MAGQRADGHGTEQQASVVARAAHPQREVGVPSAVPRLENEAVDVLGFGRGVDLAAARGEADQAEADRLIGRELEVSSRDLGRYGSTVAGTQGRELWPVWKS